MDAAMLDTDNKLNTAGQTDPERGGKKPVAARLGGMCIDVMKLSPTSIDAVRRSRRRQTLYWAEYTHGNGGTFGVGSVEERAPGIEPTDL